jgi:hypothetical protein
VEFLRPARGVLAPEKEVKFGEFGLSNPATDFV